MVQYGIHFWMFISNHSSGTIEGLVTILRYCQQIQLLTCGQTGQLLLPGPHSDALIPLCYSTVWSCRCTAWLWYIVRNKTLVFVPKYRLAQPGSGDTCHSCGDTCHSYGISCVPETTCRCVQMYVHSCTQMCDFT